MQGDLEQVEACPAGLVDGVRERFRGGVTLAIFRQVEALTRAEVMDRTGLSRSTVNQRIDTLIQAGLITAATGQAPTRGRPADRFCFNRDRGVLLVADIGATGMRTAVCDVSGQVLIERDVVVDVTQGGPEVLLSTVDDEFDALLAATGRPRDDVLGIGLDVRGPVDFARGRVVSPPIMNGWDGYDIRARFRRRFECPVLIEKDVNAMAWGEQRTVYPHVGELLMLKVGTGVGAG
ncbi:MAG TPA: ROK family transcriptional regulator, partial [Kineosporiaceae bacterium]|nr:ROK family transcriptional regulator [Kineosporiaceae bacterium]